MLLLIGLLVVLWAVAIKRLRVSVLPEPQPGMPLVVTGPYTIIRHPMYFGLLVATAGWILDIESMMIWAVWGMLLGLLLIKIDREETALVRAHPEYNKYKARTWRLLPPIY